MSVFVLLLLASLSAQAAEDYSLKATVDKNAVRVGETVTLTFTFNGAISGVPTPPMPPIQKLKVIAGPYSSTNFELSPGRRAITSSFSYTLRALQQGEGSIEATKISYGGREYSTQPIRLTILSASAKTPGSSRESRTSGEDVFLRVFPSKTEVYQGEQFNLLYKLYFAAQISEPQIVNQPGTAGFWAEDFPMPNRLVLTDEIVNGRAYKVAEIRKTALFPTTSGDLSIEPLVVRMKVERQARRSRNDPLDIFSDPFFRLGRQMEEIEVQSSPVKIRVRPLPTEEAPQGFAGVVGSYSMRASVDRAVCAAHDAVTLSVRVEGVGNIKTLPEPTIAFPADVEHYEPKTSDDIRKDKSRISGSKSFEFVLIPRAPGTQTIASIPLVYFDPDKQRFFRISTDPITLQVSTGEARTSGGIPVIVSSKRGVESVGNDIAFVKIRPGSICAIGVQPHQTVVFWVFTTGPWVALAGALFFRRKLGAEERLSGKGRIRLAVLRGRKNLETAETLLNKGNVARACGLAAVAIEQVAESVVGKGNEPLTHETLAERWQCGGYDESVLQTLLQVQERCDFARFASASSPVDARILLTDVRMVLDSVENLRSGGGSA